MRIARVGPGEASEIMTRTGTPFPPRRGRRSGIVLIVVLAELTLFEAVGMTFALYSETVCTPALRDPFADDAFDLALHSLVLAQDLHPGLVSAIQGHDLDGRTALEQIDAFAARAAAMKKRIREAYEAEEDPRIRESLVNLGKSIEELQAKIECLRYLIEQILREG
jgi:hypothetical protein